MTGTTLTVNDVTANGGSAILKATTGNVTAVAITATSSSIQVMAPAGKITVSGAVHGTNLTQIFSAKTTISLQGVTNANGDVRIFANSGTASGTAFMVGAGGTNGVPFIDNISSSANRAIYISNGTGTGGITYSGTGSLQSSNSSGTQGSIILDGGANGKVTLSGSFNVDGSAGQQSGNINIFAPQVVANGATISASSPPGSSVGFINVITALVTVNSGGLTVNVNGNGLFTNYEDVNFSPVGSFSVMAPQDPSQPITFGPYQGSAKPLKITGTGAFAINANGDTNGVVIAGYPLTINPATTTITQAGSNNEEHIVSTDGSGNFTTLTFGKVVKIYAHTTAAGQAQNNIQIDGTSIAALASGDNVLLDASGTNGGDGSKINLTPSSGALSLGDATGPNFTLNANGGSSGGKGGPINAGFGGTLSVTFNTGNAIVASAQAGNGDGGNIDIEASTVANGTGASVINANSKGTGNGGSIKISAGTGTLNLGSSAGKLSLSATGSNGTGNGGNIELANLQTITVSNDISVAAGTNASGNGTGGMFYIHDFGSFQVTAGSTVHLIADGHGTGTAGTINIGSGQNTNPIVLDNSVLSASGDTAGSGAGGSIYVIGLGSITAANATFNANGGGTGGDAGLVTLGVNGGAAVGIDISTAHINANASNGSGNGLSSSGKGGTVEVSWAKGSGANPIDVNGIIVVDGGDALAPGGQDGRIILGSIICQQNRIGSSWPKSVWNCAHPNAPTVPENTLKDGATSLPPSFKTALAGTQIYIFDKSADYNAFFLPSPTLGVDVQGYSIASQKRAAVFEHKGAGSTDISGFLKGALNHELGHLLNAANGNPQGTAAFITAYTTDKNNMTAATCMQVFNDTAFCNAHAGNAWQIMVSAYIGTQPIDSEMFAFGFQTCSGYSIYDLPLDNAEFTNRYTLVAPNLGYMSHVNVWMNGYWPGGCH